MNLKQTSLCMIWCTILSISCNAIQLTIINHTSDTIFAGTYYVDSNKWGASVGPAQRITPLFTIAPNDQYILERPAHHYGLNRELLFSASKEDLQSVLDKKSWQSMGKVRIGAMRGFVFHIAYKNNALKGYDNASWTVKNINSLITGKLSQLKEQYCKHHYAAMTATVLGNTDICPEEIEFQQKRLPLIQKTLEQSLGIGLNESEVPIIDVCLSGGGARAMMCSFALLIALRELNLVNAIMYVAALSGSTWFLANWFMSGLDLKLYKDILVESLTKLQLFSPSTVAGRLWPKYLFGQDIGIVDLYGVYLANSFFPFHYSDETRQQLTLSMFQKRMQDGRWPFPVFTAGETTENFNWCTFTPYQFSCDALHYSMPIWAFGRRFSHGKSIDIAPESSLGFLMGIWGSALSGSLQEMLEIQANGLDSRLFNALTTILEETGIGELRLAAIKIFNPLYHIPYAPFEKNKHLIFVDAGYGYNIPLPPLFHPQRHADIIFILDVSENVHDNAPDLHKAEKQLRAQGIQLPPIDYKRAMSQPISIFSDKNNPKVPTIIYVAPIKNDRYDNHFDPAKELKKRYSSVRFMYNKQDIETLTGLIIFNILDNQKLIFDAIKEKIKHN